jgi:hypothetical protein
MNPLIVPYAVFVGIDLISQHKTKEAAVAKAKRTPDSVVRTSLNCKGKNTSAYQFIVNVTQQ